MLTLSLLLLILLNLQAELCERFDSHLINIHQLPDGTPLNMHAVQVQLMDQRAMPSQAKLVSYRLLALSISAFVSFAELLTVCAFP